MLLALADHWDTHSVIVVWVAAAAVILSLVPQMVSVVRRRSLLGHYYPLAIGVAAAIVIGAGWNYFGWTTLYTDTGWSVRHHRFFGRVLIVAADTNGDWIADAKAVYHWSNPWDPEHPYEHSYRVAREDNNLDGRWDTWWEPVGTSAEGRVLLRLRADTDLDGKPDFEAIEFGDAEATSYPEIRESRGF